MSDISKDNRINASFAVIDSNLLKWFKLSWWSFNCRKKKRIVLTRNLYQENSSTDRTTSLYHPPFLVGLLPRLVTLIAVQSITNEPSTWLFPHMRMPFKKTCDELLQWIVLFVSSIYSNDAISRSLGISAPSLFDCDCLVPLYKLRRHVIEKISASLFLCGPPSITGSEYINSRHRTSLRINEYESIVTNSYS